MNTPELIEQLKNEIASVNQGKAVGIVVEELRDILSANRGLNLNVLDHDGKPVLFYAGTQRKPGSSKLMMILIQHGADVEINDVHGVPLILQLARRGEPAECIEVILEALTGKRAGGESPQLRQQRILLLLEIRRKTHAYDEWLLPYLRVNYPEYTKYDHTL